MDRRFVTWVALVMLALPAAALDLDLVPNGELDSGLTGWGLLTPFISTSDVSSSEDANACTSSGSLDLTNSDTTDDPSAAVVASGCIPGISSATSYRLAAQVRLTSGHFGDSPSVGIAIGYFDTADCSGLPSSTDSSPIADATSTSWQAVSTVVTPPVGTVAAEVFLAAIKAAPSDPSIDALFDRVFLGDSALIAADDFEIGETCRWSATSP